MKSWVFSGGIGGLLYIRASGAAPVHNHYNARGDVIAQTSSAGIVTFEAQYEAFGTRKSEAGAAVGRQKANTKDEDPTGLLNEGFRYRCLETGIFITRDPMGFVDGPNVYTYVRQNPWTYYDPHGLSIGGWFADTLLNADTLGDGAELVTGADYGTVRGWAEGAFGVVTVATNVVDVATNAVPGVGQVKAVVKKQIIKTIGKEVLSDGVEVVLKEAVQHADDVVKVSGKAVDKVGGTADVDAMVPSARRVAGDAADNATDAANTAPKVKYIGKMDDLKGIPREQTLLDDLPDLGSPRANYYQNTSVLRKALRDGYEIRDASPLRPNSAPDGILSWPERTTRQSGLGWERNVMDNKGFKLGPDGRYVPK